MMPSTTRTPTPPDRTTTSRMMSYRLAQLRQKMATLEQEREDICSRLGQDLVTHLTRMNAFDLDYETLLGGILDVIVEAKGDAANPGNKTPRKPDSWKKSGALFLLSQGKTDTDRTDRGHRKKNQGRDSNRDTGKGEGTVTSKPRDRNREETATRETRENQKGSSSDEGDFRDSCPLDAAEEQAEAIWESR